MAYLMSAKDRLKLFEKGGDSKKTSSPGPKKIGKLKIGGTPTEEKSQLPEKKLKKIVKKKSDTKVGEETKSKQEPIKSEVEPEKQKEEKSEVNPVDKKEPESGPKPAPPTKPKPETKDKTEHKKDSKPDTKPKPKGKANEDNKPKSESKETSESLKDSKSDAKLDVEDKSKLNKETDKKSDPKQKSETEKDKSNEIDKDIKPKDTKRKASISDKFSDKFGAKKDTKQPVKKIIKEKAKPANEDVKADTDEKNKADSKVKPDSASTDTDLKESKPDTSQPEPTVDKKEPKETNKTKDITPKLKTKYDKSDNNTGNRFGLKKLPKKTEAKEPPKKDNKGNDNTESLGESTTNKVQKDVTEGKEQNLKGNKVKSKTIAEKENIKEDKEATDKTSTLNKKSEPVGDTQKKAEPLKDKQQKKQETTQVKESDNKDKVKTETHGKSNEKSVKEDSDRIDTKEDSKKQIDQTKYTKEVPPTEKQQKSKKFDVSAKKDTEKEVVVDASASTKEKAKTEIKAEKSQNIVGKSPENQETSETKEKIKVVEDSKIEKSVTGDQIKKEEIKGHHKVIEESKTEKPVTVGHIQIEETKGENKVVEVFTIEKPVTGGHIKIEETKWKNKVVEKSTIEKPVTVGHIQIEETKGGNKVVEEFRIEKPVTDGHIQIEESKGQHKVIEESKIEKPVRVGHIKIEETNTENKVVEESKIVKPVTVGHIKIEETKGQHKVIEESKIEKPVTVGHIKIEESKGQHKVIEESKIEKPVTVGHIKIEESKGQHKVVEESKIEKPVTVGQIEIEEKPVSHEEFLTIENKVTENLLDNPTGEPVQAETKITDKTLMEAADISVEAENKATEEPTKKVVQPENTAQQGTPNYTTDKSEVSNVITETENLPSDQGKKMDQVNSEAKADVNVSLGELDKVSKPENKSESGVMENTHKVTEEADNEKIAETLVQAIMEDVKQVMEKQQSPPKMQVETIEQPVQNITLSLKDEDLNLDAELKANINIASPVEEELLFETAVAKEKEVKQEYNANIAPSKPEPVIEEKIEHVDQKDEIISIKSESVDETVVKNEEEEIAPIIEEPVIKIDQKEVKAANPADDLEKLKQITDKQELNENTTQPKELPHPKYRAPKQFKSIPEEFYDTLFYFSGMGTVVGSALSKGVYVPQRATKTALDVECIEDYEAIKDEEIKQDTHSIRTARHQAVDLSDELRKLQGLLGGLPNFVDASKSDMKIVGSIGAAPFHAFQPIGKPRRLVQPLDLSGIQNGINTKESGLRLISQRAEEIAKSTPQLPKEINVQPSHFYQARKPPAVQAPPIQAPLPPPVKAPSPVRALPPVQAPPPPPVKVSSPVRALPPVQAPLPPAPPPPAQIKAPGPQPHLNFSSPLPVNMRAANLGIQTQNNPTGLVNGFMNGPSNVDNIPRSSAPIAPMANQPKQGGVREYGVHTNDPKTATPSKPWQERYGSKTVEDSHNPMPFTQGGEIPGGLKPWQLSRLRGFEAKGYQFTHEVPKSGADFSDSFYHGNTTLENVESYSPFLVSRRSQSVDREKKVIQARDPVKSGTYKKTFYGSHADKMDSLPYSDL